MTNGNPAELIEDTMNTDEISADTSLVFTHKTRDTTKGRLDLTTLTTNLVQTTVTTRSRVLRTFYSQTALIEKVTESSFETDNVTGELISVVTRDYTVTSELDSATGAELLLTNDPLIYPEFRIPKSEKSRELWCRNRANARRLTMKRKSAVVKDKARTCPESWRNGAYNPMSAMDPCKEYRRLIYQYVHILVAAHRNASV